jgi:hypothetical protein
MRNIKTRTGTSITLGSENLVSMNINSGIPKKRAVNSNASKILLQTLLISKK